MRKYYALILTAVLLSVVMFFRLANGFWPVPEVVRKMYYVSQNEKQKLKSIVLDDDFRFYEEGYCCTEKLPASYPLAHFVILRLPNTKNQVSVDYEYSGQIRIELLQEGQVIYGLETDEVENVFAYENAKASHTYCFSLAKIQFPVEGRMYEGLTVKLTVVKADELLKEYAASAVIVFSPDLIL